MTSPICKQLYKAIVSKADHITPVLCTLKRIHLETFGGIFLCSIYMPDFTSTLRREMTFANHRQIA